MNLNPYGLSQNKIVLPAEQERTPYLFTEYIPVPMYFGQPSNVDNLFLEHVKFPQTSFGEPIKLVKLLLYNPKS